MPASSLEDIIAKLHLCKDAPHYMADKINAIADKSLEEMTKQAGDFLHYDLDDEKHTLEEVKAIIDIFPGSLSVINLHAGYGDLLPVQHAVNRSRTVSFIPLLAEEGSQLGVGSEGSRGGLLEDGSNAALAFTGLYGIHDDEKCKQVLEKLRDLNLLKIEDIQNFDLLHHFLADGCAQRFEMLVALDPDSLITTRCPYNEGPLVHQYKLTENTFGMILKAGMEHFPENLGCLFRKFNGKTACQNAFDIIGTDEAMRVICRCIPPGENHPILHMAAEADPHLVEDTLMNYYRDEAFIRDATGRTLSQVQFHYTLRKGNIPFSTTASVFVKATDDHIEAKDPRSGLYPFMLAASENRSDLDAVNYLLRRCPKVLVDIKNTNNGKHRAEGLCGQRRRKKQRQSPRLRRHTMDQYKL